MPSAFQLAAQRADRGHPRLHRPDGALPGAGPGRVRHPGAYHPGVLGHVDRGHPLIDPLVLLVVDHLRSHLCHRSHLLCLSRWVNQRAARGPRSAGNKARNTDRRAQGNSVRPSGQGPSAQACGRVRIPKSAGVTGNPHSLSPTRAPARQHDRQPPSGSDPRPPRPAPWPFSRPRDHPPDEMACGIFVGHAEVFGGSRSWSFRDSGLQLPGTDPRLSPRGWPAVDCPGSRPR